MTIAVLLGIGLGGAVPQGGTTYRSSELGWKAAQEVSREFGALVRRLKPGDRGLLEDRYELRGGPYPFPDDFVLEAVPGAGFNITDTSPTTTFFLGNRNVIRNLTVAHPRAPRDTPKTTDPRRDVDYVVKKVFVCDGKDGVVFEYCRFEGNIGSHVSLKGGRGHVLRHSHIMGGYWAVTLEEACLDCTIQYTFFQDVHGECLKTLRGHQAGTQRALIEHCVFQGAWRDGIDTTGGFKDSVVRDCLFRRNDVGGVGGGIDLKKIIEAETVEGDLHPNVLHTNIRIERCEFIDVPNAVVVSLIDRANALTGASAQTWAPHDIHIDDCVVEKTEGWPHPVRFLLVKGGHGICWKDLQRRGDVLLRKESDFKVGRDKVVAALFKDIGGTERPPAAPRPYREKVPFEYGPRPLPMDSPRK